MEQLRLCNAPSALLEVLMLSEFEDGIEQQPIRVELVVVENCGYQGELFAEF